MRCLLRSFCAKKRPISQADCGRVMRSGSSTITGDVQHSGWMPEKLHNTSRSQNCTKKKVMVTVWWSEAGLIHHSFLNPGETITAEKYCRQIDEMHQKLQRMCLRLVNMKGPIILHDNVCLHVAQLTLQKRNEIGLRNCLIRHIHRTSRPPIITFSSISTTSCAKKCFKSRNDA